MVDDTDGGGHIEDKYKLPENKNFVFLVNHVIRA